MPDQFFFRGITAPHLRFVEDGVWVGRALAWKPEAEAFAKRWCVAMQRPIFLTLATTKNSLIYPHGHGGLAVRIEGGCRIKNLEILFDSPRGWKGNAAELRAAALFSKRFPPL